MAAGSCSSSPNIVAQQASPKSQRLVGRAGNRRKASASTSSAPSCKDKAWLSKSMASARSWTFPLDAAAGLAPGDDAQVSSALAGVGTAESESGPQSAPAPTTKSPKLLRAFGGSMLRQSASLSASRCAPLKMAMISRSLRRNFLVGASFCAVSSAAASASACADESSSPGRGAGVCCAASARPSIGCVTTCWEYARVWTIFCP
mmetsp:Transcript_114374/g.308962  ORF Transcript_114374/g.308962 Transcript_114374/m.308962 type:complete len:204 (+) Transcript_114374:412-1023(+)